MIPKVVKKEPKSSQHRTKIDGFRKIHSWSYFFRVLFEFKPENDDFQAPVGTPWSGQRWHFFVSFSVLGAPGGYSGHKTIPKSLRESILDDFWEISDRLVMIFTSLGNRTYQSQINR